MILPIVSSISRELFLGVPHDLKEGALALGTTRWEMVRGVMFPYARGGIAAALILGLGRAIGEADRGHAGDRRRRRSSAGTSSPAATRWRARSPRRTRARRRSSRAASLIYLGAILLVFSLLVNLLAQWIVRRSARKHGITRGGHA